MIAPELTIDPYDDNFASLPGLFNDRRKVNPNITIPDFVKQASILTDAEVAALPDHVFAVIGLSPSSPPLRKYACVDKAHTAVNTLYFINSQKLIPSTMRVKAAQNLVAACQRFELTPPQPLIKIAEGRKTLIKSDGPPLTTKLKSDQGEKCADVSGTTIMPLSAVTPGDKKKISSYMSSPYVEIEPIKPERAAFVPPDPAICALGDQFPLVTSDQIKVAAANFDSGWRIMHPRDRHDYCIKLAAAARPLNITLSKRAAQYGALTYAPSEITGLAADIRYQEWGPDSAATKTLQTLMTKKAELEPQTFVEALADLDIVTGLDTYWDRAVPDPWHSTFGITKEASWSWEQNGEQLTEAQLQNLVMNNREKVATAFGPHLTEGLTKSPVSIFESLPLDQKRIIARMAKGD